MRIMPIAVRAIEVDGDQYVNLSDLCSAIEEVAAACAQEPDLHVPAAVLRALAGRLKESAATHVVPHWN